MCSSDLHLLNLLQDPSNISGTFRGIFFFLLSSSSFLSCWKATVSSVANPSNDLSSASSQDRRFRRGKEEGRLLGVLGSEVGLESSGNPASAVGPRGGFFPPFPPWRSALWDSRKPSRSRTISFRSATRSLLSLNHSSVVGRGGRLVERFRMPFQISAVVLTDSALASWNFYATVVFSSSRFLVDWIALAIFSSTLARAAVCS